MNDLEQPLLRIPDISFINTNLYSPAATHFKKHGVYTYAPPNTREYELYWDQEVERCLNGYSVGGVKITGYHYFYLNYCRILLVEETDEEVIGRPFAGTKKSATKVETFPHFWDGDYFFFKAVEKAKKVGKHLVVLKARRKGYSYKIASMLSRNYFLKRKSKNYAFAYELEYLTEADGFITKCWENLNFIDANTAWTQYRLTNRTDYKFCGYKKNVNGTDVTLGRRNFIAAVTLKDNADRARGKDGELGIFEEAGKFPNLLPSWEIAKSSYEDGAFTTGTMIAFGTGGTKDADFSGLSKLFYEPEANGVLAFENVWDKNARGTSCGFFVPAYRNFKGFMDNDGNSNVVEATEYFLNEREFKKNLGADNYNQYICEFPLAPEEAMLVNNKNVFPTRELREQFNYVISHKLDKSYPCGHFYRDPGDSGVRFKIEDIRPVPYAIGEDTDTTGCVAIIEAPFKPNGFVPDNLYVIGHDPYAHDGKGGRGRSLGAAYVIKMPTPLSPTYSECIVAGYVGRPTSQNDYNEQLFLLAEYYNAKIGFENDRGNVKEFAEKKHLLKYLAREFKMLDKKELQSKNVQRGYGMHMTDNRKQQGEFYIRDWLLTYNSRDINNNPRYVLQSIVFPDLLQELLNFYIGGNFDRVMALMIGMYHMHELIVRNRQVDDPNKEDKNAEFFNRQLFA